VTSEDGTTLYDGNRRQLRPRATASRAARNRLVFAGDDQRSSVSGSSAKSAESPGDPELEALPRGSERARRCRSRLGFYTRSLPPGCASRKRRPRRRPDRGWFSEHLDPGGPAVRRESWRGPANASESREKLADLQRRLMALRGIFDLPKLKAAIAKLEEQTLAPGFWDRSEESARSSIDSAPGLEQQIGQHREADARRRGRQRAARARRVRERRVGDHGGRRAAALPRTRVRGADSRECWRPGRPRECDRQHSPGTGGNDAKDWAQMLAPHVPCAGASGAGTRPRSIDYQEGERGRIDARSFSVQGDHAFGYFRSEKRRNRSFRIRRSTPTLGARRPSGHRGHARHRDEIDIQVKDDDIEITTMRAGARRAERQQGRDGGSAEAHSERHRHRLPRERSQHQNRRMALKMLKGKLTTSRPRSAKTRPPRRPQARRRFAWQPDSQLRPSAVSASSKTFERRTRTATSTPSSTATSTLRGGYLLLPREDAEEGRSGRRGDARDGRDPSSPETAIIERVDRRLRGCVPAASNRSPMTYRRASAERRATSGRFAQRCDEARDATGKYGRNRVRSIAGEASFTCGPRHVFRAVGGLSFLRLRDRSPRSSFL